MHYTLERDLNLDFLKKWKKPTRPLLNYWIYKTDSIDNVGRLNRRNFTISNTLKQ